VKIPTVSRKQSLEAKSKLLGIRERITKGEDFEKLAKEYSEEPAAKVRVAIWDFKKAKT